MNLTRSRERVSKHGEVFTPEPIVNEMHALIPEESWSDPTMIYLEPTCGNGQFVVAAVQKKIDAGLTPYQAVNTVFGMDIMKDNIDECRARVFELVRALVPSKESNTVRCVIVNNIFPVKDSLTFIKTGKWDSKKFYMDDPTGSAQVLCAETRVEMLNRIKKKDVLP